MNRLAQINFALADIKETLAIWRDESMDNPYVRKLWAEWDRLTEEKYRLERKRAA